MPFELLSDEMIINMGPQHPSTHGVLRLMLRCDGEVVKEAVPHIGYLHRCAEKICENVDYFKFIPYTDRMDYLGAFNNNLGYCLAVENLIDDLVVPKRAQYLRVIFAELNRIASHLIAVGTYGLDIGAFTPFFYCWREREKILTIFEKSCGARLTFSFTRIGGMLYDITDEIEKLIRDFCDEFPERVNEYNSLLTFNRIFIDRTANVGVIPAEMAIDYAMSGPCLRASGISRDIRKLEPYSSYNEFDFDVVVGKAEVGVIGDCWNRYYVRVNEMLESVKIVKQALDKLKDTEPGSIRGETKKVLRIKDQEGYSRSESPRGELGFYIVAEGETKPYRCKIRGPSFCNMNIFQELTAGYLIADLVATIGSIDIVLGDVDR